LIIYTASTLNWVIALNNTLIPTPLNTLHIYIRVSSAVQRDEGTSLKTQLDIGERRAKSLGFFTTVWDEGGKSSNHEDVGSRPKLAALYTAICAGEVKHLFVYDQSRLSRSDGVASAFRYICNKQGVRLYTKDGEFNLADSTDRLLNQILDAMAEFDNSARMDRALTGRYQRAREGMWFGGKPAFGYVLRNRRLCVNKREAKWVRFIFRQRAKGTSIATIKRQLDKNNVKPRYAKTFSFRSIVILLRNTRYIGTSTIRDSRSDSIITVKSPRIVTTSIWEKAQRELDLKLQKNYREQIRKQSSLLADLAYCGHCGRGISIRISQSTKVPHYTCNFRERLWKKLGTSNAFRERKKGCGFNRSAPADHLDELVIFLLEQTFKNIHEYAPKVASEIGGGRVIPTTKEQRGFLQTQLDSLLAERAAISQLNLKHRTWVGSKQRRRSVMNPGESANRLGVIANRIENLSELMKLAEDFQRFEDWFQSASENVKRLRLLARNEQKECLSNLLLGVEIKYIDAKKTHSISLAFKYSAIGKLELSLPPLDRLFRTWVRQWSRYGMIG
jgi:DNA invertase Pin-like site-specific DNA recombinase